MLIEAGGTGGISPISGATPSTGTMARRNTHAQNSRSSHHGKGRHSSLEPSCFPPARSAPWRRALASRAGEASGSLSQIFDRLAEFERTRDDLRGYIVSSLIYPCLLTLVGLGSIFVLLNFVVPKFAQIFSDPRMKIPTPNS